MSAATQSLNPKQFTVISEQVHRLAGIRLPVGKEGLVQARLSKRLRALKLESFDDYLQRVESDRTGAELALMIDLLTTNKTSFFRESQHFDFLRDEILPPLAASREPLRIWSAACSTGEEPYTIAMVLREALPDIDRKDLRVLATDISERVLNQARAGEYARSTLADVPAALLNRYYEPVAGKADFRRAASSLRRLIRFARLNLMDPWPMRGPFQVIFCRNVMIYFDRPTQQKLVQRFWELLEPGGHLLVGHSESLTALDHRFDYVQPATYRK